MMTKQQYSDVLNTQRKKTSYFLKTFDKDFWQTKSEKMWL